MKRLMNYGKQPISESNESKGKINTQTLHFKVKAADGKTYGIVKECSKYYIKVAPEKLTDIITEDFDHINGFNNKKLNEYDSYAKAYKVLEEKIIQINEVANMKNRATAKANISSWVPQSEKGEWLNESTNEMRQYLDRQKEIMVNSKSLLKEDMISTGTIVKYKDNLPEAPGKNPSTKDKNGPFDKDFTKKPQEDRDTEKSSGKPSS
ncbi:MAG: hypothetical protein EZS28_031854, partial [Streblomastix strix]